MSRKALLLCPIGLSPPVVTEFYRYVREETEYYPKVVVLIGTREERVIGGMELSKYAIWSLDRKVEVIKYIVDYSDVYDVESTRDFMNTVFRGIIDGLKIDRDQDILINVAGGRKTMVVIATLSSMFIKPSRVYHVINRNVKVLNEKLEALSNRIIELGRIRSEAEKWEYFRRYRDEFMDLMYPPREDISVIEIPLLPYPGRYIELVARIVEKPVRVMDLEGYEEYIDALVEAGYIDISVRDGVEYVSPSDKLRLFREILVKI